MNRASSNAWMITAAAKRNDLSAAGAKLSKLEDYLDAADVPTDVVDFIVDAAMTALTARDYSVAVDHFTYGAFLARRA